MSAEPYEGTALTLEQCGLQLQVSTETLVRWIREGHLKAFMRPGAKPGQRPGRKSYRVWPADWAAFCRRHTIAGAAPVPIPPPLVVSPIAVGPDGICRRKR